MSIQEAPTGISPRDRRPPDLAVLPDLSICIVNWNCSDYLRGLLRSIEAECEEQDGELDFSPTEPARTNVLIP
jgi:hypothetical protein